MRGNNFVTGKYRPSNPRKYKGDVNRIIYRSSWELCLLRWMDDTPEVVAFSSEELVIPYISEADGKKHRYFVDFEMYVKTPQGIKRKLIEVKPYEETKPPKRGKNQKEESYREAVRTWLVNSSKWEAARAYAKEHGAEFIILTEREIFPSNHSLKRYQQPKNKTA